MSGVYHRMAPLSSGSCFDLAVVAGSRTETSFAQSSSCGSAVGELTLSGADSSSLPGGSSSCSPSAMETSLDAAGCFRIQADRQKPQLAVSDNLAVNTRTDLGNKETAGASTRLNCIDSCCCSTGGTGGQLAFASFYTVVTADSVQLNHSHLALSSIHSKKASAAAGRTCA